MSTSTQAARLGLSASELAATKSLVSGAVNPVLGDAGAASTNVTAINAAIASLSASGGGKFTCAGSGIACINAPVIMQRNVDADFGGVRFKLVGGIYRNLLTTSAYQRIVGGEMIQIVLTWVGGRVVSAARSDGLPHGLVAGDWVTVFHPTLAPSNYKGTFCVSAITDAINFVYRLHRTPRASPSGTAAFTRADENVTVRNGVWDQDYTNNTGGVGFSNTHAMILGGASNVRAIDCEYRNVAKYCLNFGLVTKYGWSGIKAPNTNSDIVHVYGPAVDADGNGVTGRNGDDGVIFQTTEPSTPVDYSGYRWTFGDVHGGQVKGVHSHGTVQGANIVLYFDDVAYMGDLNISNIDGGNNFGVNLCGISDNAKLDTVTIEDIRPFGTIGLYLNDYNGSKTGITINSIRVIGMSYESNDHTSNPRASAIYGRVGVTVNNLTLVRPNLNDTSWPGGLFSYWGQVLGPVKTFTIESGTLVGDGTTNANLLLFTGAVEVINIDKTYAAGLVNMIRVNAGTPKINIDKSNLNTVGVISAFTACSVSVSGSRLNLGSNGLVRSNAAVAIDVSSGSGNTWVAGAPITNGSAAATWTLRGFDLAVDAGLSGVSKSNGSYFMNTGAGRGTLTQNRLVVGNGTVLSQLDTPANTY